MASQTTLEDINEKLLQCFICLRQLKEPKSLPCLHHYCRDCLAKTVKEEDEDIKCPTCRQIYSLPPDGVDGFKTDFNTKSIVEFIQLQNSIKDEPVRACVSCEEWLKASAYCFKCCDFLCQSCHEFHKTNTILKDHRPHIFPLSEAEARNLTMEKLAAMKEPPRCLTHPERLSDLCCTTCNNLPICIPCVYGIHQDHTMKEVSLLAKMEREKLIKETAELMKYKEKIYRKQEELKDTQEKLDLNVEGKKAELQEQFNLRENEIKREIKDRQSTLQRRKDQLKEMLKRKISARGQELETEMKQAQDDYEKFCKEEREANAAELEKLLQEHEEEEARLHQKLKVMNGKIKETLTALQTQEQENSKKIKEMSDHLDDTVKRFENITMTVSSILTMKNDWTDAQCIGDICTAIGALIVEVKKDFPELELLSGVSAGESTVDIEDVKATKLTIWGITGREGWDCLVISGGVGDNHKSHITVIDMEGKTLKRNRIDSNSYVVRRSCDFLSPFKVATVCSFNEIGIFDVRDHSYSRTNISDIAEGWPGDRYVSCVAVDAANKDIIVGSTDGRDVYIFNEEIKYLNKMTLPEIIQSPTDISVHRGNLLICDEDGGGAYAVTMKEGELVHEFPKPDADKGDWRPRSVCTDKRGLIYMLWRACTALDQYENKIVQYSQDGQKVLTTRSAGCKDDIRCIMTAETDGEAKILMATHRTGKLIRYSLS